LLPFHRRQKPIQRIRTASRSGAHIAPS